MATLAFNSVRTWSPRRHASGWAVATLLATAIGVTCAIAILLWASGTPGELRDGLISCLCYLIPYGVVGAFLVHRRPDLPFGWLLSAAAAALALSIVTSGWAFAAISNGNMTSLAVFAVGLGSLQFVEVAVQGFINVRFPSGRVTSRFGRVLDRLMLTGLILVTLGGVFGNSIPRSATLPDATSDLQNPLTGGTAVARIADSFQVWAPLIVLLGLIAGLRVVVLARRAHGIEREQLRWRAVGVLLSLTLFPLAVSERLPAAVDAVDGLLFVATLVIPVVFYGLWEIDAVIRRSAAYALVTVALAVGYVAIAAVGAALASERVGVVVAAIAVALAFGPARNSSQRLVDRLFYGQRNDPYRALSDVSRHLEAVAEPGTVLVAVVAAVAESLRLPYVAIARPGDGLLLAAHGEPGTNGVERWPLTYQGATVGALLAAPRRGEVAFDARDRVVLGDLARQCGPAVHAEALTADLIESRQRLVNAREEERRRLRRDLHDGLGPMLTGLGLNVDAARTRLALAAGAPAGSAEMADADEFLARVKEVSSQAIVDLRGIVYGLRPPALDDLGLVGAVRAQAARLAEGTQIRVVVEASELGELPAAVEVAAFRIAIEAVNNVVRHSGAHACSVRLCREGGRGLVVEVADDGSGSDGWTAGVGLLAMRERAVELGGSLTARSGESGGRVCAVLPVSAEGAR
jgi:two-component system, NarL family, sensor kinase